MESGGFPPAYDEIKTALISLVLIFGSPENNVEERIEALEELWELSGIDLYKPLITLPEFGILSKIQKILMDEDHPVLHQYSLGCLWYLTRDATNRLLFCKPENIPLLNLMMRLLRQEHPNSDMIRSFLLNCSLSKETHSILLSPQIGYVEMLQTQMQQELYLNTAPRYPYRALCYISMSIENQNLPYLLERRVHEFVFHRLFFKGSVPASWPDRNDGIEYWCLNFLLDIISQPKGTAALQTFDQERSGGLTNFFIQLLNCQEIEGIKAICILSPLLDRQGEIALLEQFPHIFQMLVDVMIATYYCDKGREANTLRRKGYAFGIFTIRVLSTTFLNLSYSKSNRRIMFKHSNFLSYILYVLTAFIDDSVEFRIRDPTGYTYAGGGGKDIDSLKSLLELLLQLSYHERDDEDEELSFSIGRKLDEIRSILNRLATLPTERNVPIEATQLISLILDRIS